MSRYWKTIIAVLTAVGITTLQAVLSVVQQGNAWTTEDTVVVALAFLGALAVYAKANTPPDGISDPSMSETAGRVERSRPPTTYDPSFGTIIDPENQ